MSCIEVNLLCFNMDEDPSKLEENQEDNPQPSQYEKYFNSNSLYPKPDLIFFQEAGPKWVNNLTKDIYDMKQCINGTKRTCVLYNKNIFECCSKPCNVFSQELQLYQRICIVSLKHKDINRNIYVASCHLPSKITAENKIKNVELLFKKLNELLYDTKCPVLIAGDFNFDLLEHNVNRKAFELPYYDLTEHRKRCAGNRDVKIDYFAYKNCTSLDCLANIQLNDVKAITEPFIGPDKKLSRHDPLSATMTIHYAYALPYLNLYLFNANFNTQPENAVETYFRKLIPHSDLCFLHDAMESVTTHSPNPAIKIWLVINTMKFKSKLLLEQCISINSIEVCTCEINFEGYILIVALCYKLSEINVTKKDIEQLFTMLDQNHYSVLIVGSFNIYKVLKEHPDIEKRHAQFKIPPYKPTIHRVAYGGLDDACIDFFAYKNVKSEGINPIITNCKVTTEMFTACPKDLVTEMGGQFYVNIKDRALAEIHKISPHDLLKVNLRIEILSPPLHLMCLNITDNTPTNANQIGQEITMYCQNLETKPDLYMFNNLTKSTAQIIERIQSGTLHYPEFISSRKFISFESEDDDGNLQYIERYGSLVTFECNNIECSPKPQITVTSINNQLREKGMDLIQLLFNVRSKSQPPTIIAGYFGLDLDKCDLHKCGFKVPEHNKSTGYDFITYKNSIANSTTIVIQNVHAEVKNSFNVVIAKMFIKVNLH